MNIHISLRIRVVCNLVAEFPNIFIKELENMGFLKDNKLMTAEIQEQFNAVHKNTPSILSDFISRGLNAGKFLLVIIDG